MTRLAWGGRGTSSGKISGGGLGVGETCRRPSGGAAVGVAGGAAVGDGRAVSVQTGVGDGTGEADSDGESVAAAGTQALISTPAIPHSATARQNHPIRAFVLIDRQNASLCFSRTETRGTQGIFW